MNPALLIRNGILITLGESNRVLQDYALLLEDGVIRKIAPAAEFADYRGQVMDAAGQVVMPGFINAHMHFYSTMVRGLGKAKPSRNFQEVLENLWWRLDRRLMLEDCYYSALLPLLDAIRQGTTTLIDHHASPSAITGSLRRIAYAVRETGLRASLCYEVSDRDGVERAEEGIQENIDFIRWSQAEGDDRFRALFGLHAAFTLSDATLDRAARTAADLGVGCHIHTAEAQSDQEFNQERYGLRVVERLHRHGVLGPNSIAAHCVHVNDRELELLAETGTAVVHNPQSNLNNAVGIADILSMNHKGVLVGLGTDAMTVNMREEVRVALWAQHLRHDNPSVGFVEALSTLLFHNARIAARYWDCGLGELKEGHAADVVLIDYIPPTPLDESTFLGHFAFGISQAPVDTTIAGGRVLMAGKQLLLDIDEEAVCRRSRELAADLWERF
jgi:putative selenium metabolism protein SsnA